MSSPRSSSTASMTSSQRPPVVRNKSSSTLSSQGGTSLRAKRNKSSSSLHASAPGHHNVQFTHHHGKKPVAMHRKSSSGGTRRSAAEFGFTSMKPSTKSDEEIVGVVDQEEAQEEETQRKPSQSRPPDGNRRSSFDQRTSSTSSVVTVQPPRDTDRGRRATPSSGDGSLPLEEGERGRSASRSKSRGSRERAKDKRPPPITTAAPAPQPQTKAKVRPSPLPELATPPRNTALQGASSLVSNASDWESATDSPIAPKKALPAEGGSSGLGQVMEAGNAVASDQNEAHPAQPPRLDPPSHSEPVPPPKAAATKSKATFEIASSYPTLGSPPAGAPPFPPPPVQHQQFLSGSSRVEQDAVPAPEIPSTVDCVQSPTTPADGGAIPAQADQAKLASEHPFDHKASSSVTASGGARLSYSPDTVALVADSATSPPKGSAVASPHRPIRQIRKSSNASLMSVASTTRSLAPSFLNLVAPPRGALRRSMSGAIAPMVDRGATARGEVFAATSPTQQRHRRHESSSSLLPLGTVSEQRSTSPVPRRAASTLGTASLSAKDRIRNPPSAAVQSLGSLGVVTKGDGHLQQRKNSGYFASLRSFTHLPSLVPSTMSSPAPSSPTSSQGLGGKGKGKATSPITPTTQPLVSKFVEEPEMPNFLSSSPAQMRSNSGFLGGRNVSSASLSGLGSMSRTQQKALLARDAPYWSGQGALPSNATLSAESSGYGRPSVGLPPLPQLARTTSATSAAGKEAREGMQKWAQALVKEAERIERQHRSVQKWRDPLGESLQRVLGTGSDGASIDAVKKGSKGGKV